MKVLLNATHPIKNYSNLNFRGMYDDEIGGIYSSRDPGDCYFPNTSSDYSSGGISSDSWSRSRLNIHNRTPEEMADLAEYFHDYSDDALWQVCDSAYWTSRGKRENYQKLLAAVKKVRAHEADVKRRLKAFDPYIKKAQAETEKQKEIVLKNFVNRLGYSNSQIEKYHYAVPNVLILHGNSTDKDDFLSWLEMRIREKHYVYWSDKARENLSPKEIVDFLAQQSCFYELGHRKEYRDVVYIGNIDEFLIPANTKKDKIIQQEFFNLLRDCALNRHVSIVGTSGIQNGTQIDSVVCNDDSVIAPLNIDIPQSKRPLYDKLHGEIQRLKNKGHQAWNLFVKH